VSEQAGLFPADAPDGSTVSGITGRPIAAHARRTDPDTSHAAAASISDLPYKRRAVYEVLWAFGPMTDEELVRTYERNVGTELGTIEIPAQSPSGIRSRRSELADLKHYDPVFVEECGKARLSTGNLGYVWRVVEQ
jgi:hypothetical protein